MAKRDNAATADDAPLPEEQALVVAGNADEPEQSEGSYWLAPVKGRLVPQEDGTPWPTAGMEDPETLYTRRRVADGDLVKVPAPKKPEGEK